MSKTISIEVTGEVYEYLAMLADAGESIGQLAVGYLEEGINLEKTLRQS